MTVFWTLGAAQVSFKISKVIRVFYWSFLPPQKNNLNIKKFCRAQEFLSRKKITNWRSQKRPFFLIIQVPFSISQKHKNKLNPLRKTCPFLVRRSKRVKKHLTAFLNSYEKLNQQNRALSGVNHVFLKHRCWSFYSFIHNLKKTFCCILFIRQKYLLFSYSFSRARFLPPWGEFILFLYSKTFFPRFFSEKSPMSWR